MTPRIDASSASSACAMHSPSFTATCQASCRIVVSLAEWQTNPQMPAGSGAAGPIVHLCKSHGKAADLFDLDCGLFLCSQCVLSHADHAARIKPVADASDACRVELDAWIGRCEHWDQRIAATDKACDMRGDEVERAHDRAKDKLEADEKMVRASSRRVFRLSDEIVE